MANRRAAYFEDKTCARCGADENLELDHLDPQQKVDHRIWSWSRARRDVELKKCQVLCEVCHMSKTLEERQPKTEHGHSGMYQTRKCRCAACREWKRLSDQKYRKKPTEASPNGMAAGC